MLPSCGHFKNIPCPFYKFALCVRPHCPYKHNNTENSQQRQTFTPSVEETENVFDSKAELNAHSHKSYDDVIEIPGITTGTTYIPTPVEFNSKPPGILKNSSSVETPAIPYVPEYKPTPISQLKECTTVPVKASKSVYTPEFPIAVRKKKNVEEYDPTEVKCIPKKTVTFVDVTDTSDVPVILISSEDELDDSENAPKFSDDDSEYEVSTVSVSPKQVPDVITIKEEPSVEEKIDEFSVVDKILVDSKKTEMLLNSYKNNPPKTNNISSKCKKRDKNIIVQSEKEDEKKKICNVSIKQEKSISGDKVDNSSSTKAEKNVSISKIDCNSINKNDNVNSIKEKCTSSDKSDNSKLKNLKDEILDLLNSPSKSKSNIDVKQGDKHSKKENRLEKAKKSSSHSNHSKEKLRKESKEGDDKHRDNKKLSHASKTDSSNSKSKKSDKHSSSESSDKKESKKKLENHSSKNNDRSCSPSKKKRLHENENVSKTMQPHIVKLKDKKSSNDNSLKRKSTLDSDFERQSSKSRCLQEGSKEKSDFSTSSKKLKVVESDTHDRSKLKDSDDKLDNDSNVDSDIDETALNDLLSSSESDPDEECRRIFEEYYPEESENTKQNRKEESLRPKSPDASDLVILRKKRYAHPAAAEIKPPNKQPKLEVKRPMNPAQVMHNRFLQSQARFAQLNEKKEFSKGTEKKRLCFAPNKSLLDAVKNKNQNNPALENFNPLPPTVSKTYKATQRTAHIPEVAKKPRPIIPAEYGCKVPANIRQKFLNSFIDNCLKFCKSEDEAYDLALEEEKKVYDRSSSRPLYLNVAANALQRLRRRAEEGPDPPGNNSTSKNSSQRTVSHEAVLNGPLAQRRSFSVGKKKEAPEIRSKAELFQYLLEYVLTPEQLKENSYPLPHPTEKDRAVIEGAYANRTLYCNDAFKRMCSRCRKTYYVDVDGNYVREEECDFHWGRLWKKRIAGNFESRYSCCQGDAESDGCCVSPGHVFEGSERHVLRGYVKTLPKTPPPDNCYGAYALDCEMCYTTAGVELTRITVVDTDLKTVYETFVKPSNKVLDYNTRFSGITEDDLKNVKTSLIDVQAVLLCLFSDKSILIGHSLESDFKALKLFHSTVIDTSVVFPHKSGLPYKRALKTLMAEKLNKIIQNDVGGHDSREDAVACMELMLWKVKEDIRGNR